MTMPSNRSGKTKTSDAGKDSIKLKKLKHPDIELKVPQVVTPSRPRIEPKGKPIVKKNMLASSGIIPAQCKQFSSNKDTKLKFCIVETPRENSAVFLP